MRKLLPVLMFSFFVGPLALAKPLIYIDPGHTLEFPGSIGTCATQEVWVNDNLSLKLARLLQADGYPVEFSRLPNLERDLVSTEAGREPIESLKKRGTKANGLNAALFISVHHDSIGEEHLVPSAEGTCGDLGVLGNFSPMQISEDFVSQHQIGFNVFIHPSPNSPNKYKNSLKLAQYVGQNFVDSGEAVANFHTPEVESGCGSCKWEDEALGVLSRNLAVVRVPTMPALLLEITNLKVPELEIMANDSIYQDKMALSIKKAVDKYFE